MSETVKQAPNLIGTWVGQTNDAVIGGGSHYPDGKEGEVRFLNSTVTYKFDKQSNRAFAGVLLSLDIQFPSSAHLAEI